MKKRNIFLVITLGILVFSVCGCSLNEDYSKDEKKFKQEYEKLNGKKTENKEHKYMDVSIVSDNNVKYINSKKTINLLKSGTGVIYLGFPECPWCCNAVGVLLDAVKEEKIDDLYYYNALSIRDTKHLDEEGKVVVDTTGKQEYYEILDLLGDKASIYEGLNDDSIKRIYFPTVIFVKDGKVLSTHVSTVDSQTDPYKKLTDKQYKELKKIYIEGIKSISKDTCNKEDKC